MADPTPPAPGSHPGSADATEGARPPGPACLNCGTPLEGPWCHECGQRARAPVQPVGTLARELAQEALDLDGRVVRSVRALLLRPGHLTLEYLAGRRASWTHPLRLYLASALVFFVVAAWTGTRSFLFVTSTDQAGWVVEWLPRVLALVVPAFAAFDHLLFERGRRLWAESLIFSLHLHAGWFLLATVVAVFDPLLPAAGDGWGAVQIVATVVVSAAQLGLVVYLWISLRRFHGRGVVATAWRMLALLLLHSALTGLLLFALLGLLDLG